MSITDAPTTRRSLRRTTPTNGKVIVVWGTAGSGKSTIALNLTAALANKGEQVLLIDADTTSASQVAQLALAEYPAGLAPMCRFARQNRLSQETFGRQTIRLKDSGATFTFVPGINPERWPEVTPQSVDAILNFAMGNFDRVVIDTGSNTESQLHSNNSPQGRFEFTRWLIARADILLTPISADPVSLDRFIRQVGDLRELRGERPVTLVINKHRTKALGPNAKRELASTLRNLGGFKIAAYLPEDHRTLDVSLRNGTTVFGVRSASPLRKALKQLAQSKYISG